MDADPAKCAKYHFDKHLNKMILESAQMMSTAVWELDYDMASYYYDCGLCYKPTHKNHPSNIWVRQSTSHFLWMRELVIFLDDERNFRFGSDVHKSRIIACNLPIILHKQTFTQPPQCMPEYLHSGDSIVSYRNYYKSNEKNYMAKWTNRGCPEWWK